MPHAQGQVRRLSVARSYVQSCNPHVHELESELLLIACEGFRSRVGGRRIQGFELRAYCHVKRSDPSWLSRCWVALGRALKLLIQASGMINLCTPRFEGFRLKFPGTP